MAVFKFHHGSTLTESGPLVSVEISLPSALRAYLAENAIPIPPPQGGFALIDTGAFASAVDQSIFDALNIPPIDKIRTASPHGEAESLVYPATVTFPGLDLSELPMERLVGCDLKWQSIEGAEVIMLLGRDLLQHFMLVYNGKSADIFLAY